MNKILKENAIFIADSHYNKNNQELKYILEKIKNEEIKTSQIFLMGDIFDFLCYEVEYFNIINSEIIKLLDELSSSFEIFYLEGNHDYNLKKVFPNINVIKRENQPLVLNFAKQSIALSHGDNFINWHYDLYCKIIRNSFVLNFLNFLDIGFCISKRIEKALANKDICHTLTHFEELINKRVKNYSEDIIIEGHYHQAKRYKVGKKEYINIPSLYCQKSYTVFIDEKFVNKELF